MNNGSEGTNKGFKQFALDYSKEKFLVALSLIKEFVESRSDK